MHIQTSSKTRSHTALKTTRVVSLFNQLFVPTENTRLQGNASEPFYQAANNNSSAIIYFREDFLSSALHEIAHWCIAGKQRRQQDDYGYWYQADGRDSRQQKLFESVEVKPQALEWAFSLACKHPFHFSADNLAQQTVVSCQFKASVKQQLKRYIKDQQWPPRAKIFYQQLNLRFARESLQESANV